MIADRLPAAPRSRRPLLAAVSAAVVCLSVAAFVSLYSSSNHQTEVLIVTHAIPQGQTITGGDLGSAMVSVNSGVTPIAVADASTLSGKRAAVTIPAGSLLVPGDVTSTSDLPSGDAVVGVALKDGQLPSTGVAAGDSVMIIQTGVPGAPVVSITQSVPAASVGLATGVLVPAATVVATAAPTTNSSSGAAELVSVAVPRAQAAAVSSAATAGQVSLVLLPSATGAASDGGTSSSSSSSSPSVGATSGAGS